MCFAARVLFKVYPLIATMSAMLDQIMEGPCEEMARRKPHWVHTDEIVRVDDSIGLPGTAHVIQRLLCTIEGSGQPLWMTSASS